LQNEWKTPLARERTFLSSQTNKAKLAGALSQRKNALFEERKKNEKGDEKRCGVPENAYFCNIFL